LPDRFRGGAVSIGNFDGVHLGHATIVERLVAMARACHGAAVIMTFDPHPAQLLHPERAPAPLGWTERKVELLCSLGVDAVVVYPTDLALLHMEPREFFDGIVRGRFLAQGMVEGRNFYFGHNRSGTVEVLSRFCAEAAMPLEIVEPAEIDGQVVSSSRIRKLITVGDIDEVCRLLNRPYRIRGTVVHGAGRGNRLGFPTANVDHVDTLLPSEGIYAGRVLTNPSATGSGGPVYAAAINIGPNPTFKESALKIEAYLLDYEGDLYDRAIAVDFVARLRDIKKFDSPEQLVSQMAQDVEATRRIVEKTPS